MQKFTSVENLVNQLKPDKPVYCIRKKSILSASKFFQKKFPGRILYAVKTNPHPEVIKTLVKSGISEFDVASISEIKSVRKFSQSAKCSFMHTVKSREDVEEAYFKYGVKTFALDTKEELIKIIESTKNAKDLEIFVRVAVSNEHAEIDLSKKFGAMNNEATGLLRLAKQYAKKIGLSFHNLRLNNLPEIICEPGRALVAESGSTIVRVNLRKKQKLYINDGTYGTLFDAGTPNIVFPSKLIKESSNKIISKKLTAFDFYGPTCDSMDYMKGPFVLPNNIKENDYIELGQLGAYGLTFRTEFNGFFSNEIYEVEDNPIMSLYGKDTNKAILVA